MRKRTSIAVILLSLSTLGASFPSHAAQPIPVVSPPGGFLTSNVAVGTTAAASAGYAPTVLTVAIDGAIDYTNLDAQSHNFISDATTRDPALWDPRYCEALKPDGWTAGDRLPACALFQDWSETTDPLGSRNLSQSAPVLLQMPGGKPKLKPATTYTFYCTYHTGMKGTLVTQP